MLKSLPRRAGRAALFMSAVLATAVPAYAQSVAGPGTYAESPEDALARNVRLLAQNPRNFQALVAAGHAALATGDTQAAVGFFGRAEELSPNSWQPQAGKAAAMVAMGDPQGALSYFARAQQLGATQLQIAVDRGLAFDLAGDQAKAQSDYRMGLIGPQADEARRRLALSLAISRNIPAAAEAIEPLLVRRDPEAVRTNAFILAFAGDREGARRTIDAFMPGAGMRFEPFFKMLPVLRPAEKAAAVHLGIFPKDAAQRYAQAEPVPSSPVVSIGNTAPQRQVALAQKQPRKDRQKPVTVAEAPRRAVKEVQPGGSTYLAMVRPSLDPSRYASSRRPRTQAATTKKNGTADNDPEPRPADRLDDIAQLLSESSEPRAAEQPAVEIAQAAAPPEPAFVFESATVSQPKVETSKPKVEIAKATKKAAEDKKKADKLAAEKKAKAEAEKKAKAEAARIGVTGTNWVQLAGGANQDRMAVEYKKLSAKAGALLKARPGYVTEGKDYFRLLVGPFTTSGEAQDFVSKLDKAGVDSFRWTRNPAQIRIEKLKS